MLKQIIINGFSDDIGQTTDKYLAIVLFIGLALALALALANKNTNLIRIRINRIHSTLTKPK